MLMSLFPSWSDKDLSAPPYIIANLIILRYSLSFMFGNMTVVLYGCETWLFTMREERKLRVFQNRLLRRICGPNRDKVTGECRKLHKLHKLHYEELNDLYCSPNIVRVIKSEE